MAKIKILNMNFESNNYPDVGGISIDDKSGDLIVFSEDVGKLNTVLTKSNIISQYGTEFPFKTGDVAFVPDSVRVFMYDAKNDQWREVGG